MPREPLPMRYPHSLTGKTRLRIGPFGIVLAEMETQSLKGKLWVRADPIGWRHCAGSSNVFEAKPDQAKEDA